MLRMAQSTDASADVRPAISARSCSRNAADLAGSRIGALATEEAFPLRPKAGRRGRADACSTGRILVADSDDRVAAGFKLPGPLRSGASTSSSPAIPTNVNKAYRRA